MSLRIRRPWVPSASMKRLAVIPGSKPSLGQTCGSRSIFRILRRDLSGSQKDESFLRSARPRYGPTTALDSMSFNHRAQPQFNLRQVIGLAHKGP